MSSIGVVMVAGHRPQRLDRDFSLSSSLWRWLAARLDLHLLDATHLRCGMALGVDVLAAERAYLLGLPYTAYIPFEGQAGKWSAPEKLRYGQALARAEKRIMVSEGEYAAWKLHARNKAMMTGTATELAEPMIDTLLAVWDGKEAGGTYQSVLLAKALGVEVIHIDPGRAPS